MFLLIITKKERSGEVSMYAALSILALESVPDNTKAVARIEISSLSCCFVSSL
jgi:hypothetical protein